MKASGSKIQAPKPVQVDIVIFRYNGRYRMNIEVDDKRVPDDRLARDYDSVSDAITSARHAVNGFLKGEKN